MNDIKMALLYNLACAKLYKDTNKELSTFYSKMARETFISEFPIIKRNICEMIDEGLINKEGFLTFKGELHTIRNVYEFGPTHLGIELNKHLRAAIQRKILSTKVVEKNNQVVKVPGCLTYLGNEELKELLTSVLDVIFSKVINKEALSIDFLDADNSAYMVSLLETTEEELVISVVDEDTILENPVESVKDVVKDFIEETKPKKNKKAKAV